MTDNEKKSTFNFQFSTVN